jgi:hypothetical protein
MLASEAMMKVGIRSDDVIGEVSRGCRLPAFKASLVKIEQVGFRYDV